MSGAHCYDTQEDTIYSQSTLLHPWCCEDRMGYDPEHFSMPRTACFHPVDILELLDKISFRGPNRKPLLSAKSFAKCLKGLSESEDRMPKDESGSSGV